MQIYNYKKFQFLDFLLCIFLIFNSIRDIYIIRKLGSKQIQQKFLSSENLNQLITFILLFITKYHYEGFKLSVILILLSFTNLQWLKYVQYQYISFCISYGLLLISLLYVLYKLPIYHFPEPLGSYQIGLKQMAIRDKFHTKVSVYYPCIFNEKSKKYTKWCQTENYQRSMHESMKYFPLVLPWLIFKIMTDFVQKVYVKNSPNAKIIQQEKKFKVIIFSHGLAGHRQSYSIFTNDLASKGYIVFSPDHYEDISPQELINAIKNKNDNNMNIVKQIRNQQLNDRQQQIAQLIKVIKNKQQMEELFESRISLDVENIVLMGHSFGGVTATQSAFLDKEIKAVIGLDPWLYPQDDQLLDLKYKNPILYINTESFAIKNPQYQLIQKCQQIYQAAGDSQNNKIIGFLKNSDHVSMTDICFIIPQESVLIQMIRQTENLVEITQQTRILVSLFLEKMVFGNQSKEQVLNEYEKNCVEMYIKIYMCRDGSMMDIFI
ncbi:hypothetical protein IMG5_108686 [Ichthyophthirius multifiliis]|uniref:1-alkyl-2-acetylglycerophosphocholine esterase n=1 Tax=Ichthyophthirius multifiliis TaxID=5932 RepID=G0QTI0_ICHMU|nr:hypothetical protein IMG5_108686 [Ichthyophthirius multifiliis]EGR31476.1 hypothetical protein IMG5_108686 [Ichthyophthirius multifiliis]|eukprot:XP_004034962.1 hypothetical protein IMG5_108686 [Ichthyophthirius multifiliis]